jgi:exoribonuclease R
MSGFTASFIPLQSSCGQYVQAEANQLVEEFMLLANMSVARFISSMLPDRALLRWVYNFC